MKWQVSALVALVSLMSLGCQKAHEKNVTQPPAPESKTVAPAKVEVADKQVGTNTPSKTKVRAQVTSGKKKVPAPVTPQKRLEDVVAKVNGVIIDAQTFYAEVDRISRRNPKIPADRLARIESNILQRLVDRELVKQAIQKEGIEITDREQEDSFKEYKKRFQSDQQFENYLKHGKVTVETIKKRLKDKKALEKLIEAKGDLTVSEEDAMAFYDKNKKFYTEQAKVKASHILLKLPKNTTAEQERAVLTQLKKIGKQLKKGADFADMAKKFSQGPSKTKGGDLGFFGRKQMLPPFSDKAFSMKPGETSGPVKTRFGYHIIRVFESKPERKKPFAEVKAQISKSLRNKKFFKERRSLLQGLKDSATVVSNLPEPPKPTPRAGRGHPSPRDPHAGHGHAKGAGHGITKDPHAGIPGAPRIKRLPTRRIPLNASKGGLNLRTSTATKLGGRPAKRPSTVKNVTTKTKKSAPKTTK